MERCWAEEYCKGYPHKCDPLCLGYVQLKNIYALSNMPKRYQYDIPLVNPGPDREAYLQLQAFRENVVENVQKGRGLFIYSRHKGNGKTTWACKVLNQYFRHVALTNNMRCRGLFINVPQFLRDLRDSFSTPSERMEELQYNIRHADIVVWDDIGTETPTNWVRETLYTFINHREANGLSQIFTSNLSLEELVDERYLGERIVDRIRGQCHLVEFVNPSRRGVSDD